MVFGAAVRHGAGWLAVVAVASVATTAAGLALPVTTGRAVDAIVAGIGPGRWLGVAAALIAVIVAGDLAGTFAGTACTAGTTAWLRRRLVGHLLAIGPERARRFDTGDLVTRVTSNAADAAQAGGGTVAAVVGLLPPVGSLVLLALIDPWLAVAFLAGAAAVALVLWSFARRTARALNGYIDIQGRIAARLAESLAGARTIAAAGTSGVESRRILQPLPELSAHGRLTWRALSSAGAQAAVAAPLVLVAVLATGGFALAGGRITAGELFAAGQYASIGVGLGGLVGVVGRLARVRAGARRADDVLAVEPVRHGASRLPDGPGRLELVGVHVGAGDAPLLDGVDLTVPGGASVAVVGRSGAGKSVLAAVAARLRDPDAGRVLLDGVPLADLTRDELRHAVGCGFERPVLFGGTVASTIAPGRSRHLAVAAARAAQAHEFITRLPDGYDTPPADAPLSGGEAQRIGLARAWPAQRLLVLDDATSSLDTVTEMRITRTLVDGAGGRTRLIVTHRAATAARADLVVWLDAGRVRAVGTHQALCTDPAYRSVFR